MNVITKTRSEQIIDQLVNIGRPLSDEESDALYRALHADYVRKWKAARKQNERSAHDLGSCEPLSVRQRLLASLRAEAAMRSDLA